MLQEMMPDHDADPANGYEAHAEEFMRRRARSDIGAATVARWAATLPDGASVLELGCGPGVPITRVLVDAGLRVHAVDASPAMVRAFRSVHPSIPIACEPVETFDWFGRTFDAVVAWGLLFLLAGRAQEELIARVASALNGGGSFLLTAPAQPASWRDVLTGRTSLSLGRERYLSVLHDAGFAAVEECDDEGDNHYYIAWKAS